MIILLGLMAKRRKKDATVAIAEPELVEGEIVESEEPAEAELAGELSHGDLSLPVEDELDVVPPIAADDKALVPTKSRSLQRLDPLTVYINDIRRYPLMSREEEHELAVKFLQTGDLELARRLTTANLRLVVKLAHEYRQAHRNLLDLIQEGNVGLVQAVRHYDPYRGVKLSSYAAWWIRAYMLKFILHNWRLVKIGTTQAQRKLFFNLRKEKERLEKMGFDASPHAIARALEVPEREVIDMERRLGSGEVSLDAPLERGGGDSGDHRTQLDLLPSPSEARPDRIAEGSEFQELLKQKFTAFDATLRGREQLIFRDRLWPQDGESPRTLQELGDHYGISRERARQLEKRLLGKLKEYLRAELGDAVEIALGSHE